MSFQLTVRRETHSLVLNIPNAVPVLQEAATNQLQSVESINESLANRFVTLEGSNIELATRNSQIEGLASLGRESY